MTMRSKPLEASAGRVAREHRRLRRLFGVALVAAAAPAPWLGCSESSTSAPDASSPGGADAEITGNSPDGGTVLDSDVDCWSVRRLGCAPMLFPDAYVPADAAEDAE